MTAGFALGRVGGRDYQFGASVTREDNEKHAPRCAFGKLSPAGTWGECVVRKVSHRHGV